MTTHNLYESILFTPLGPEDIVVGEVLWGATRGLVSAVAVLFVATIFGLVSSPWAILALPVAYLVGLTFSCYLDGDDGDREHDRLDQQLPDAVHPADVLG